MAVTHAKVSGKADGGDATLVQPTDWNASHSIGDIIPAAANTYDLGSAASAFDIAYVRNVAFPATQSASADANTLDDYQEGTWTPGVSFDTVGNLNAVYTTRTGTYTKVGRMVHISAHVVLSTWTHTTASGSFRMTDLPFAESVANEAFTVAYSGLTLGDDYPVHAYTLGSSSSQLYFIASRTAANGGWITVDVSNVITAQVFSLMVSGTYTAA